MKKEILYPIFLKCVSYVDDTFWRFIYEDLSYGKCPYGLSLYKNHLSCYIKGKEFSYKVDNDKDSQLLYKEVDKLLREKVGILSDKEKIQERARVCRQRNGSVNKKEEWTNVKKKMVRDTLLEQYVLNNTKQNGLDILVAKKVLSLLIIGLMFKTITTKDIFYENGFITKIQGFQFQKDKVIVSKDILHSKNTNYSVNEEINSSSKMLHSYWNSYLEEIKLL